MLRFEGYPFKRIDSVKFTSFPSDELRKLSVKQATNPNALDALKNPNQNGLYDNDLGPFSFDDICGTCKNSRRTCTGHFSHIELPVPVFNPVYFSNIVWFLKASCFHCERITIESPKLVLLMYKMQALDDGMFATLETFDDIYNSIVGEAIGDKDGLMEMLNDKLLLNYRKYQREVVRSPNEEDYFQMSRNRRNVQQQIITEFQVLARKGSRCIHCGRKKSPIRSEYDAKIYMTVEEDGKTSSQFLTPALALQHFNAVWRHDSAVLSAIFSAFQDLKPRDNLESAVPLPTTNKEDEDPQQKNMADLFFVNVLLVPPPRFRPCRVVGEMVMSSSESENYSKIIMDCAIIRLLASTLNEKEVDETDLNSSSQFVKSKKNIAMLQNVPGETKADKLQSAWFQLQQHVNILYDGEMDKTISSSQTESSKTTGMKQLLEKKQGLFRMNMMGKRVNYAARSVISPDPYIATNEIGLPLVFATKLTYPEPVTPWNREKLWKCIVNGPDVHPGATRVITSSGQVVLLSVDDKQKRIAVANKLMQTRAIARGRSKGLPKPMTVLRHIRDGDLMLVNRQPTLHKGSMMAHTVRVLPNEKTLRLHYANCKSYNADFDGDEMNAHFPQSEPCRAEALNLMSTNTQYLSGKDGAPLSGLIQDHMVAGVDISMRGRFFNRDKYQQLVFNALSGFRKRVKFLPPTILKPKVLWSGKQIFSTLFINLCPKGAPLLNLVSTSKIQGKEWQTGPVRTPLVGILADKEMCESEVIIKNGKLLTGVLDKNHYGASMFGLVHATHELYGGTVSGQLLTSLARLFTAFLQQYRGFTLSVSDILVTEPANMMRHEIIRKSFKLGLAELAKMFGIKDETDKEAILSRLQDAHLRSMVTPVDEMAAVDHEMKRLCAGVNDSIAKACMGSGLIRRFPKNNLQLMVISGAKGGSVNCMQISCLLGQIELEGRRPPLMPTGRTAPSFRPYDTTLRGGGFVSGRFLSGIRPQEYFYHCMAGREGLIDTAVKTSRSGYLQRCLIKHLEGLVLNYDLTVRDSDGSIVQFLYGEDGLDVCLSDYLHLDENSMKFLTENYDAEIRKLPSMAEIENSSIDTKTAKKEWKKLKKTRKAMKRVTQQRISYITKFMEYKGLDNEAKAAEIWYRLSSAERHEFKQQFSHNLLPDPPLANLQPDCYINSTSEKFQDVVKESIKKNPWKLKKRKVDCKPTKAEFESLLNLKYQRSLSQPGTCVGVTAAQSVGEPSTQMTLNTFHFAGRGEMNVTLGIPRLREILMVASQNIGTPQMTIPVRAGMQEEAEKLQKKLTCIQLDKVLHKINTQQYYHIKTNSRRSQRADIIIHLLPQSMYKDELGLKKKEVFKYIENFFIRRVMMEINNQIKQRRSEALVMTQRVARELSRTMNADDTNVEDEDIPVDDENENSPDGAEEESAKHEGGDDDVEYDDDESDTEQKDEVNEEENLEGENSQTDGDEEDAQNLHELDADNLLRVSKVERMVVGQVSVHSYQYDKKGCKIVLDLPITDAPVDLVAVLRQEAQKSLIRSVPGITRCIVQVDPYDKTKINFVTEGINFHKMFEYENILDLNKMYSNCVHSMANTYGVEAAVRVITKEIQNVFAVYGIGVDPRHLNLIADYMCFEGVYLACNRTGMNSCASPLQQMTFETTMKFLKSSALTATWDSLNSPSARIITGQIIKGGTGIFDLKVPWDTL